MSGEPSRKRTADTQISKDDYDNDDRDNETFVVTPQVADEAEMATRRVVRVRRPEPSSTPSTGKGFFKNLSTTTPAAAPAFKSTFGEASTSTTPSFGFTSKAMDGSATNHTPAFSFGSVATEACKSAFSCGASATTDAAKKAEAPATFCFGSPPPPSGSGTTAAKPVFTFGAAPAATTAPVEGKAEDSEATAEKKPIFGSFCFASAVTSFAEARQKLDADRKPEEMDTPQKELAEAHEEDGDVPTVFTGQSVVVSAGEVLTSAPVKLYSFDKEGNMWVGCGEGLAKLKFEDGEDQKAVYRMLVRDGYSLNAKLGKNLIVLGKEAEKHIIFSIANKEGALTTYLMKFTGNNAETNAKVFIEKLKGTIETAGTV